MNTTKKNIKMTRGVLNSSTFDTFNSTAEGMQKNEGRDRITAPPLRRGLVLKGITLILSIYSI